ncbi:hypothetical protein PHMEG_00015844, partial [Phytophthora megakarya]
TNGHLNIVKWLHEDSSVGCTKQAMDRAACNDHLEVVKLHVHRTEGCTTNALDGAAQNGISGFQVVHAHRREGCTTRAMTLAANDGHRRVVQWLYKHRSEDLTFSAVHNAARGQHFELFFTSAYSFCVLPQTKSSYWSSCDQQLVT